MIRELQEMGRAFQAGCATIGTLFRWGVVIVGTLYVLVNYGLSGLFSVAIILGFLLGPSLLFGHTEEEAEKDDRPDEDIFNKPARFGPTDRQKLCDPIYKDIYPHNIFNK